MDINPYPDPVNAEPLQLAETHETGADPVEVARLLEGLDGYRRERSEG